MLLPMCQSIHLHVTEDIFLFLNTHAMNKQETHHTKTICIIKFKLLMVVNIKVVAFLDVTLFGLADRHLWHCLVWHLPNFME